MHLGLVPGRNPACHLAWRVLGLALVGLVLLLGGTARAQDDPPGRVGRLAALQGEVWVFEAEQGEWVPALLNRPFTNGDRVSTAAAGSVELRIGSTTLLLGGGSELEALRLDDERMQFRLHVGSLALKLRAREAAAEFEVLNDEGRFAPQRAGLYRIDRQDETSDVTVWRGELRFDANDLSLTVHAGQRARMWQTGALRVTASQWLAPLDDEFTLAAQRMDQADSRSAAAQFVPPEMTGVEELDRYGRWQEHPEYGAVWSPSVVVAGWAPYRYGQWIWLNPWGWTWVDDAPWGFAPFHYGRWFWWGNRWCWTPGPRVPRPVFAPALVGWVGGAGGVVVGGHTTPAVGWVPLAPREIYRPGYRASAGHVYRLNPHAPPGSAVAPPAFGNRVVPGAVTVVPALAPHQSIAAAAQRADDMALRRQWQAEQFRLDAPGRPAWPQRETGAPRPPQAMAPAPFHGRVPQAVPQPTAPQTRGSTVTPTMAVPGRNATGPPSSTPPAAPPPMATTAPAGAGIPAAPAGPTGHRRPSPPAPPVPAQNNAAPAGPPAAATPGPHMPPGPFRPPVPAAAPVTAAPPNTAAGPPTAAPHGPALPQVRGDVPEAAAANRAAGQDGERRRTPESRYPVRER